jgi:hypothetical protein
LNFYGERKSAVTFLVVTAPKQLLYKDIFNIELIIVFLSLFTSSTQEEEMGLTPPFFLAVTLHNTKLEHT